MRILFLISQLLLDQADRPNDPFTLFNLGWNYEEMGRPGDALPFLKRSLALSHPSDSIVRKLYTLIVDCHRQRGEKAEALAACREGRQFYPNDAALLFQEGIVCREQGDRAGAEACWLRVLGTAEGPHFASVAEGLRGHKARNQLAVLYFQDGRLGEAEAQWKAALAEQADFAAALLGLGEVYLAQGRWAELEKVASRLPGTGVEGVERDMLQARACLSRKDFAAARELLEQAIGIKAGDVRLWMVLNQTLLQEGTEWEAAERALAKVLELQPGNAEARANLAMVRQVAAGAPSFNPEPAATARG
jgi:tetratricopeptide (TPR) repeat protein